MTGEVRASPPARAPSARAGAVAGRPIVKWAGGKRKLLGELLPRVPPKIRTYVEPFAGGAALFFELAARAAGARGAARPFESAALWDSNPELCACYRAVQQDAGRVIRELARYRYDKALFYEVRGQDTRGMSDTKRAARLIFLNKTCFNGLWRVNSKGLFNVPFGRYAHPKILDRERLLAASAALAGVKLRCGDFADATRGLGEGDFVYFDPPYDPASATSDFTSYSPGGFSTADQRRLAGEVRRLSAAGVRVLLSNADTPAMRELYAGFRVCSVKAARSINAAGGGRGSVGELLVVGC